MWHHISERCTTFKSLILGASKEGSAMSRSHIRGGLPVKELKKDSFCRFSLSRCVRSTHRDVTVWYLFLCVCARVCLNADGRFICGITSICCPGHLAVQMKTAHGHILNILPFAVVLCHCNTECENMKPQEMIKSFENAVLLKAECTQVWINLHVIAFWDLPLSYFSWDIFV